MRIAPGFADAHFRLGCVRLRTHRPAEARRNLETALRINPRFVGARVELALLDAREGLLGEALDTLRRLPGELGGEGARDFEQGLESLEHADWDEAGVRFREALCAADPTRAIEELPRAAWQSGRPAARAARCAPRSPRNEAYPDLHYLLGVAELEQGPSTTRSPRSVARSRSIPTTTTRACSSRARSTRSAITRRRRNRSRWCSQADPEHPLGARASRTLDDAPPPHAGPVESASGGGRAKSP